VRARLLAFPLLFLVLLVACGDTDAPGPEATSSHPSATSVSISPPASPSDPPSATPSVSPSTEPPPEPTPEPDLQVPADAPTVVDDPSDVGKVSAGDLAPLVPPRAETTFTALQRRPQDPLDQIALAWRRGPDAFASTHGFVVWQRFPGPSWRALYAFTDRPSGGVLGITMEPGDLTGDGIADLLTNEQTGGTGACGRWRVVASEPGGATEIFRRDTCDTEIAIAGGELRIREAVYEAGDPHCCPSAFRVTTLGWNGREWRETSSEVQPVDAR
jgi:hypothetical protein